MSGSKYRPCAASTRVTGAVDLVRMNTAIRVPAGTRAGVGTWVRAVRCLEKNDLTPWVLLQHLNGAKRDNSWGLLRAWGTAGSPSTLAACVPVENIDSGIAVTTLVVVG